MSENILLRDKMIFSMFRSEHLNLRERTMNNHRYLMSFIPLHLVHFLRSECRTLAARCSFLKSSPVQSAKLISKHRYRHHVLLCNH